MYQITPTPLGVTVVNANSGERVGPVFSDLAAAERLAMGLINNETKPVACYECLNVFTPVHRHNRRCPLCIEREMRRQWMDRHRERL